MTIVTDDLDGSLRVDVLRKGRDERPHILFIHTEVYKGNGAADVAPGVSAMLSTSNPSSSTADFDCRIVVERLDIIFDERTT